MAEETNTTPKKPNNFWIDFGPLLVFFIAFQYFKRSQPDQAMLWAYLRLLRLSPCSLGG